MSLVVSQLLIFCLLCSWHLPVHFFSNSFIVWAFFCYSPVADSYLLVCWIRTSPPDCREGLCYMHSRNRLLFLLLYFFSQNVSFEKRKKTSLEECEFCLKSQINCQKKSNSVTYMGYWQALWQKLCFSGMWEKYFQWKSAVGIGSSPCRPLSVGEWTGHFILPKDAWHFAWSV